MKGIPVSAVAVGRGRRGDLLWKTAGVISLVFIASFLFRINAPVQAATVQQKVLQAYGDGTSYVLRIRDKITNVDIANNAGIKYKKLNLKHSIKESDLKDDVVTTAKLADGSVTSVKILDAAITEGKIDDGAITGAKLASNIAINTTGTVTAASFLGDLTGNTTGTHTGNVIGNLTGNADTVTDGVYTTGSYADPSWITSLASSKLLGPIAGTQIADSAITTSKIADAAVTHDKMAPDSIDSDQIVDGTVANSDLADGSVSTAKVQDGAITGAKLASNIAINTTGTVTAASFLGDLTGNTTGNHTGAVTGNVTGNLLGTVTGNLFGTVTGTVMGNLIGNVTGNADTVTNGVYTTGSYSDPTWIASLDTSKLVGSLSGSQLGDGTVTALKLAGDSVGTGSVQAGAITNAKLANDAVSNAKVQDGAITGAKLAPDASITTSGDIHALNLVGGTVSDGVLSMHNGNIASSANALDVNVGGNASDADVFIRNSGTGKANLNVEGNITGGGSVGTNGSRWSTIYADAINFISGLTNADNTTGTDSTINLGTAGMDKAEVHIGNPAANVTLADADWSVAANGDAVFHDLALSGLSLSGGISSSDSFSIDLASASDTALTIRNSGTGAVSLVIAGSGSMSGSLTLGGQLLVSAGGIDVTGNSNVRGDIDMNKNVLTNIGNNGTDFTAAGGLTLAGQLTANGGIDANGKDVTGVKNLTANGTADFTSANIRINSGTSLPGSCSAGELFVKTDGDTVNVTAGNASDTSTAYFFVCTGNGHWKAALQN